MTFEEPKVEFIALDLEADITAISTCITTAVGASGVETCNCNDSYKDGTTAADEPDCGESFEF